MNRIKGSTGLIALLGKPVKHSKSPYMHNRSFEILNLDFAYMAFEIENHKVEKSVEAMRTLNAKGFNITMPYKEEVMMFLDEIDKGAKLIGSVNTVLNNNGKLIGYNTDGQGFVKSLEEKHIKFTDEKIVILGSGGSARAIAIQLALDSAREIVIANRTIGKAETISDIINKNIPKVKAKSISLDEKLLKEELKDAKILINTTSIGMDDTMDKSLIRDTDTLHKDLFIADIIYNPSRTKLLSQAQQMGCKTMNGLNMLVYQGALAFKMWTGRDMPKSLIKDILEDSGK